jgi:hypothetical protein
LVVFDKLDNKHISWLILAVLLAFSTQQIRTIGIALIIALLVILFLSRRFKEAGVAVVLFIVGFSLQSWLNLRNGGTVISSGYEAQVLSGSVMEKLGQVLVNTSGYFDQVLAGSLIPIFGTRLDETFGWLFVLFNIAILLLLALGVFATKPKFEWMHMYVIIYVIGILSFWNPQVGSVKARFLIPILPFLYFYSLNGLRWLTKENARIAIGIAALIALVLLARNLQDWRAPVREQMTDLSIGASWVAENAPANAIVMVNEPVPAYVHAQRKTINFPRNDQVLEKYLDNQGISYILIAPSLQSPQSRELDKNVKEILAILEASPQRYELVFDDPQNNVRVYTYK